MSGNKLPAREGRFWQGFLALVLLIFVSQTSAREIRFNRDIRPILSDKCFQCHGPDAANRESDLRLDREEDAKADRGGLTAIAPGDVENSEALYRIFSGDPDVRMPPDDLGRPLTAAEKQLLRQWIEQGAAWEPHWAFAAPERPELPKIENPRWARNAIDVFVKARLDQEGLSPSPEAAKETLIRRVTLDLTGVPPTLEEIDAFLADDSSDAYQRVVNRLLQSQRYGETMALPWLDAARFADTDGYQFDGPRGMWRWRDWVIDAFNSNMPFDQFTVEQLAGDLLPDATLQQRIATGFNRNHRYNSEAGLVVDEFLLENAVDRVDTTATVWLGLTLGCARCHDHKYDPISQKDYYQLIAFFNAVPEAGRAIKQGNSEPYITAPLPDQQAKLDEMDRDIAAIRKQLDSSDVRKAFHDWVNRLAVEQIAVDQPIVAHGLTRHEPFAGLTDEVKVDKGQPIFSPGIRGDAAIFDGHSALTIGKFGRFRANDRFSLAFWMRPGKVDDGVVLSRQKGGTTRPGVAVELHDGRLRFLLITRWVAGAGVVETVDRIEPEQWVHVTVTNDGSQSANGQKVYLDGKPAEVRVLHNTNSNVGGVGDNDLFRLGSGVEGADFRGAIDEFRYYDRTLWPEEALRISEPTSLVEIARLPEQQRAERQRDVLCAYFLEHGSEATSKTFQALLDKRRERQEYHGTLPTTMVMADVPDPKPTHIRIRGVYHQLGERVDRDVPAVLPSLQPILDAGYPRSRLGLAQWLVDGNNPLTARVTVNRWWQRYFGTGLVKTSEDFGVQGEPPSHPDLLDWLATELVASGWDVAHIQKLIVTSATYRQSSIVTPELLDRDPENRLLARMTRLRLPAHSLRDQALSVSGLLVEQVGGPSVSPYQPPNLWAEMSMGMKYRQSKGDDLFRRSLYTIWKRTVAPPSMAILDAADREACWVRTKRTNTPLQALTLLNETAFVESARHLATRMLTEGSEDPLGFGFRMVTARRPSDAERTILASALEDYRREFQHSPTTAEKLIATGTTPTAQNLAPAELAAHTVLANVLLNLDEVITKE
jgi:hypothetical protein